MYKNYRSSQLKLFVNATVGCALALMLSGCENGRFRPGAKYRAPVITEGSPAASYMTDDGWKIDLKKIDADYVTAKNCAADAAVCAKTRDQIINQFLFVSDRACGHHLAAVSANNAVANFTLGSITSLTAGLAAFVGSGATPQALSASAAFASGSRSLMNETFYGQQVAPIITKAIRENRDELGVAIRNNLAKDATIYPIDRALYDVGRYHESCSFYIGVELIDRAIATQRKTKSQLDADIAKLTEHIVALQKEAAASGLDASLKSAKEATIKSLEEDRKTLMKERITASN